MAKKKSNAAALARFASQLTGGGREMISVLVSIARSDMSTNAERIAAAKEVLDRTCGKSMQVVEHDVTVIGGNYDLSKLSSERIREIKGMLLELASASGAPAPRLPEVIEARAIEVTPLEPIEQPELVLDESDDE